MSSRLVTNRAPMATILLMLAAGVCGAQETLSRIETWQQSRDRMAKALLRFNRNATTQKALRSLKAAGNRREFHQALEPLVVLDVSINPESRVKVSSRWSKIQLQVGQPRRFLIKVDNTAGITAPLNLAAMDVSTNPPSAAKWCSIEVVEGPHSSRQLSGASTEFKVMWLTPQVAGLREVRIVGDAGQGTQDLGFRATTDVLLDVDPTAPKVNAR